MAKKASDELCLENYIKMKELFNKVIPNKENYKVVYACGVDVGMMNFVVARKTTYTYSSYAVGYDEKTNEIIILPIDIDLENYGTPFTLKKESIKKAKQSFLSKEITIHDNSLPQKYIQFSVPEFINQDEDNVCLLVKQIEEAKEFTNYFKTKFSK